MATGCGRAHSFTFELDACRETPCMRDFEGCMASLRVECQAVICKGMDKVAIKEIED